MDKVKRLEILFWFLALCSVGFFVAGLVTINFYKDEIRCASDPLVNCADR